VLIQALIDSGHWEKLQNDKLLNGLTTAQKSTVIRHMMNHGKGNKIAYESLMPQMEVKEQGHDVFLL